MKAEFQRENEDTLESIRQTSRELKLQLMTINQFIPKEYQVEECVCVCVCVCVCMCVCVVCMSTFPLQDLLDAHVVWHEDTGEWHVVCGRCGLLYTVIWVWHVLYSILVLYCSVSKQQFALFRTLL